MEVSTKTIIKIVDREFVLEKEGDHLPLVLCLLAFYRADFPDSTVEDFFQNLLNNSHQLSSRYHLMLSGLVRSAFDEVSRRFRDDY